MRIWILGAALVLGPAAAAAAEECAFEVHGTVVRADDDDVKIARQGKPTAELDLRRETEIRVDGKAARARDLRPGQEVRATFELHGDDPTAVRVEARSTAAPAR